MNRIFLFVRTFILIFVPYMFITKFVAFNKSQSPNILTTMANCIFCKIKNGDVPSDIIYQDDEILIFKDARPISQHHYLAIPKEHIPNVNALSVNHRDLLLKMKDQGKKSLAEQGADVNQVKLGFHVPPFNSISHLHLHIISPVDSLSWLRRITFRENTWWFASADEILNKLKL